MISIESTLMFIGTAVLFYFLGVYIGYRSFPTKPTNKKYFKEERYEEVIRKFQ